MRRASQLLGMALLIAGLLLLNYLVFDLGRYGTCASGGPYVIARECADGTELKMAGILLAVVAALIGTGLARSARVGVAAWGMLFASLAITFVMIAFGPAAGDNGFGITAIIVGLVFFAMALPALWMAVKLDGSQRTLGDPGR